MAGLRLAQKEMQEEGVRVFDAVWVDVSKYALGEVVNGY